MSTLSWKFIKSLTCLVAFGGMISTQAGNAQPSQAQRRYDNQIILQVKVTSTYQWEKARKALGSVTPTSDIWKEDIGDGSIHVRIQEDSLPALSEELQKIGIHHHVLHDNVQGLIESEKRRQWRRRRDVVVDQKGDTEGRYHSYNEILSWMEEVSQEMPELVETMSIGQTYEGREMMMLKIGLPTGRAKWSIWLDGGIHAREWISPATLIYMTDRLLKGYKSRDPEVTLYMRLFDFYILPVLNIDGYIYTWTRDRLWRKNRRMYNDTCGGVDLNRNWNFHWGEVYSSRDPCHMMYQGEHPHSEPEVANIANFLLSNKEKFVAFISYHSYGQRFFTRWGYTKNEVPEDNEELLAAATNAVSAMTKVHGITYTAGSSADLMYAFSGGSADWAKGVAGIKFSYLIELRDSIIYSNGMFHGFMLPEDQIRPTGEENWVGLKVILSELSERYENVWPPVKTTQPRYTVVNEEQTLENGGSIPCYCEIMILSSILGYILLL